MHKRDNCAPAPSGRQKQPSRRLVTDPAHDDLDQDQVRRWAEGIVQSDTPIAHFSPRNRHLVEAEVRALLRERMLRLVAKAIAHDIVMADKSDGA